jgi:hypothetical protein
VTTIHIPRRPRVGSHGRHVEEPPRPQGIIVEFGAFLGVHGCECPANEQVRFSNGWMTLPNLRGEVIRDKALGGRACTRSSTARRLGYAGTTSSCNVPRLCSEPQRRRLMAFACFSLALERLERTIMSVRLGAGKRRPSAQQLQATARKTTSPSEQMMVQSATSRIT